MLRNYIKIAWRGLGKSPLFTSLNILGLSLGLAVSLLLFMYVRHELAFDRYHANSDRTYRVIVNAFWDPARPQTLANAPNAVGPEMKENIPAVEQSARLLQHGFGESAFVNAGETKLVEDKLYWADPTIADIFDIPVTAGDLKAALSAPNCVALSRSAALRYFGTSNPVGRNLRIDQMPPMEVKAVFEDFPGYSSLEANILGSFSSMKWASQTLSWSNSSFETWVLLNRDADRFQVEKQMAALLDTNVPKEEQVFSMWLQPLRDLHLNSAQMSYNYTSRLGDPNEVRILGILALAVLLIACFNYMNLSTARAQQRFREVGINKTMGASRGQLAVRFFAETAVLTSISLVLAGLTVSLGLPYFNELADKQLSINELLQPGPLLAAFGIGAAVVLAAGAYPALFLSSFRPRHLLQTAFSRNSGAGWFRRSLVTTQFSASVLLIICTLVLYRQMEFVRNKNLGFHPEQVLAVTTAGAESRDQVNALIQHYEQLPQVQSVCRAQTFPGGKASVRTLTKTSQDQNGMQLLTNRATPGFEKVLGIRLLAGAGLPEKALEDTLVHVVLTKAACDYLGYSPEEAIGRKVYCSLGDNSYVCGVLEDFHAESLHKEIGAYAFHDAETESRRFLLVKLNTTNLPETMSTLESGFRTALPQSAFEYKFLDDQLDKLYRNEQKTAHTVLVFSLLSILISCLGLFGLAAYAAEQRRKEIGIRRVLGASLAGITGLLSKDFLKLVFLAILIASPLAWYLMHGWLADFAYRIEMQWWMFALAALAAIGITFLTVGFHSLRAALVNPVQSLKSD